MQKKIHDSYSQNTILKKLHNRLYRLPNIFYLFFCRGNLKEPGEKECVLIIDRHTGEITLEKLSGHMLLKKTRQATKQSAQIKSLVNNSG